MYIAKCWRGLAGIGLAWGGFVSMVLAAPVVTSVAPPPEGVYGYRFDRNEHYTHITVTFSEPITVTGFPSIGIRAGAVSRQSHPPLNVRDRQIVFGVAPVLWDNGPLTITGPIVLNGGTIQGADGSPATLTFEPVSAPGVVFDYTAPGFPVIQRTEPASPTSEQAFTVFGTAEPRSSVSTARVPPYLTAGADANGNWSMVFPPRAAGTHTLYFYATDTAGNESHPQRGGANGVPVQITVRPAQPPPTGAQPQTIEFVTPASELASDQNLALSATATSGLPVTFNIVSGPALIRDNVLWPTATSGTVTIRAVQAGDATFASVETTRVFTIFSATRLINLSSRVTTGSRDSGRTLIAGFVLAGSAPKQVLVRGVGPGLAQFGVQSSAANPRLRVFDHTGRVVNENDDWAGGEVSAASERVGAFALDAASRDAALLVLLSPGAYTLHVDAMAGEGVALAEIYDASIVSLLEPQQMINLSTRGFVGTGESVLTAGFVIRGGAPKRVLVRGIGPALGAFGVQEFLPNPELRIRGGAAVLAENDDWEVGKSSSTAPASAAEIAAAAASVGAFALAPGGKDAAVVMTLPPGAYTATVNGVAGGTGTGLVEVYDLSATSR